MSNLSASIKDLYSEISDEDVVLAETNLIGFFKTLERVEARLAHEKCNEANDENIRSTN